MSHDEPQNSELKQANHEPMPANPCSENSLEIQSRNLPQFCKDIPEMSRKNIMASLVILDNKKGYTEEEKLIIFELYKELLFIRNYFNIYPTSLTENNEFKRFMSKELQKIFKIGSSISTRDEILSQFLYDNVLIPEFHTDTYNITPLCFNTGLDNTDLEKQFFKYGETDLNEQIVTHSEYFWRLYNNNHEKIIHLIEDERNAYIHQCLYAFDRIRFSKGPVALLFSGGVGKDYVNFFADELNCCIFSHHLIEMGYKRNNILCFIEGKAFEAELTPFQKLQIQVFYDTILCSYVDFKHKWGYQIFEKIWNNPNIFAYSILKAVMDSKGPVLIYFTNHGNKNTLYFPYPPHLYSQEDFMDLCTVLDTFGKYVLFILDCCGSEEFVSNCHYNFIHFITSSINKTDNPNLLEESISFYTMSYKSNINQGSKIQKNSSINLSSQFTRHLLDSLYMIRPNTSLIDFVDYINFNGCYGFKAKLQSIDPTLIISKFLQSPTFKYFDYSNQIDNYQQNDIIIFNDKGKVKYQTTYFSVENGKIDFNNRKRALTTINRSDESDFDENEDFISLIENEYEEEIEEEEEEDKIPLKNKQAILIVDEAIKRFATSHKALDEKRKNQEYQKGLKYTYLVDWFTKKYKLKTKAYMYASNLIPLYSCHHEKVEEIMSFIDDSVQNAKGTK